MLPCSGNRRLVTGAMDCSVQLHVLDAAPSSYARVKQEQRTVRWVPDERNEPIPSHTTSYSCHSKRVKVQLPRPIPLSHLFLHACNFPDPSVTRFNSTYMAGDPHQQLKMIQELCCVSGCGGGTTGPSHVLVCWGGWRCTAIRHSLQVPTPFSGFASSCSCHPCLSRRIASVQPSLTECSLSALGLRTGQACRTRRTALMCFCL